MKKLLALIICIFSFLVLETSSVEASSSKFVFNKDVWQIKSLLNSQVRFANRNNFNKFIATYADNYKNADGFDLETYSSLVRDIWDSYDNIKYGIRINDVSLNGDKAEVYVTELSNANIPASSDLGGCLKSEANSIYYLRKINGKWKVESDKVLNETSSMLYGDALDLDISLTAPREIEAGIEYTASLEFEPPQDVVAVASISRDKVEYPQKQPQEVYRKLPDDNLLERLFVSNTDNANEYVVATIGLTKADIDDLNIKLSLTGFGYKIVRVNVIPNNGDTKDDEKK